MTSNSWVTLDPGCKVRTKVGQMVALSDQVKRRLARYLSHYGGHLDDRFLRNLTFFWFNVCFGCKRICKYLGTVYICIYNKWSSWSSIGQFKSVSVYRALVVWNG